MIHRMTTSGKTSDNEWQRVVLVTTVVNRVKTNDNNWQRVVISVLFFRMRGKPNIKDTEENSLNLEENQKYKKLIQSETKN